MQIFCSFRNRLNICVMSIYAMKDPLILSALVQSIGTIIAAVVAAIAAGIIGKRFLKQDKSRDDLEAAKKDIRFLLEVEEEHCGRHKSQDGKAHKNIVRDKVRKDGSEWSGRFTPGRI